MTISNQKTTFHMDEKDFLHRLRINGMLENSLTHSLTTVIAGAGYGKTQNVLNYLSTLDANIAWIQFTESDNYSLRFWQGFIQVLSILDEDLSIRLERLGFPDELDKFHQFLKIFSNKIYEGIPFIIVFDDCHLIHNKTIYKFIENLMLANLENLSIFLLSRNDIDINYVNVTDKNLITHIDMEDLAFTDEEIKAYFALQNLSINDKALDQLYTQTEGWPFAIYLISVYLKRGGDLTKNPATYTVPIIYDMIENEVFSHYPEHIQYCLIRLSILDNFSLGLIKELVGEHLLQIISILEESRFINYNALTKRYYFHHLFLEFLVKKQPLLTTEEITMVYERTADWYVLNAQKLDALIYYEKYQNYEQMWNIIWSYNPGRFSNELTELFIRIIKSFPTEFIQENPLVEVIYACLHNGLLDLNTSIEKLKEVIAKLEIKDSDEKIRTALGEANIMLGFYYMILCSSDFKQCFKKASEYLPNGSTMFTEKFLIVNTDYSFTLNTGEKGEMISFIKKMFETMPYAEKVLNGSGYGREYLSLAEANYKTGNMDKATEYVYHAIYKGLDRRQIDIVCSGYYLLCRISVYNGNFEDAMNFLDQMHIQADKYESEDFFALPDIADGWLYSRIEREDKIADWITKDFLYDNLEIPLVISREKLLKAYILLTKHQYHELSVFLTEIENIYLSRRLFIPLVFLHIFQALAQFYLGEYNKSLVSMKKAYKMSAPNYIIMPFIELGAYTSEYVDYIRKNNTLNFPEKWLETIYNKSTTYAKRLTYIKTKYEEKHSLKNEPAPDLTGREIDILQSLCQGLTREEIADDFNVSVNTVKYTLKNIYAKLGAINGIDAARIATLRGLVS